MTFFLNDAFAVTLLVNNMTYLVLMIIAIIFVVFTFTMVVSCLIGNSEERLDRIEARANIFQLA